MTCDECSHVQDTMEYVSFVRVGKANVMIVGCKEHLAELIETYRHGMISKVLEENEDKEEVQGGGAKTKK